MVIFHFPDRQLAQLRKEVTRSKRSAYAKSTNNNLRLQWKTYIAFALYFDLQIVPTTIETLCLYAQFLSRSFKAISSVQNYVSAVKKLHLMLDVSYPQGDFELRLALKGLSRNNPHCPKQARPITPAILRGMSQLLDISKVVDSVFWALFLTSFFSLARKSKLVQDAHGYERLLKRQDVQQSDNGLVITFRWTKTIQCGQRLLQLPIPKIPGSLLCPVTAYNNMTQLLPAPAHLPAFILPEGSKFKPVSYNQLTKVLKHLIASLGLDPQGYSSHSFRRGGATFAFKSGARGELVKAQGDWLSDAYLKYLDLSMEARSELGKAVRDGILQEEVQIKAGGRASEVKA